MILLNIFPQNPNWKWECRLRPYRPLRTWFLSRQKFATSQNKLPAKFWKKILITFWDMIFSTFRAENVFFLFNNLLLNWPLHIFVRIVFQKFSFFKNFVADMAVRYTLCVHYTLCAQCIQCTERGMGGEINWWVVYVGSAPLATAALLLRIQSSLQNHMWTSNTKEWPTHVRPPKNIKTNFIVRLTLNGL